MNESCATATCARPSVARHLLRGIAGFGALAAALYLAQTSPWLALGCGAAALLLLRGCPMCWTIGLIEAIAARRAAKE